MTAAPTAESDYRQIADLLAGSPAVWGSEQIITGDGLHQLQLQLKKEDTGAVTDPGRRGGEDRRHRPCIG